MRVGTASCVDIWAMTDNLFVMKETSIKDYTKTIWFTAAKSI